MFHSAIILPIWLNYVHLPAAPSLVFVSIDGIDERHLSYLGDYVEGWNSCEMYSMRDMTLLCLFMHECILDHMHGRIQLRETKTMEKISSFGWKWLFSSASLEWSRDVSTCTILVIGNINRTCQLQNRRSHRSLYVRYKVCLHLSLYEKIIYDYYF